MEKCAWEGGGSRWWMGTRAAYLVVGLAPRLGLGVVILESLEVVDSDVEVGDMQDCVEHLAGFS